MLFRKKIQEPNWNSKVEVGAWGEKVATRYLKEKGYKIVAQHWTHRIGEIDIIATKDGRIIFVEVKTRTSSRYGTPEEGITWYKQQRLARTANVYMIKRKFNNIPYQIDSIAVICNFATRKIIIRHMENVVSGR